MKIRRKFQSIEEAKAFISNLPITTIIEELAECYVDNDDNVSQIRITQQQFDRYFKIIGVMNDGTVERRGRKKKIEE